MITKDNLISAYFIDNERKNIEVLIKSEDSTQAIPIIIPFNEKNNMFKMLMDIVSLDDLHEVT